MIEQETQKRIFGLDLMRALAILMVVFGHCVWIFPEGNSIFHQLLVLSSFLGVEIFFVLSGFLIGKILYQLYLNENFTFKSVITFLKRRWFRTLPNYYLILIINIGIATIVNYPIESLWKYFFFLQNASSTMLSFFPESWSLSVEEFAYLVVSISILVFSYLFKNKKNTFLYTLFLLILFFISNKWNYNSITNNTSLTQWNMSLKAVVLYRLDSIFIGLVCSWFYFNCTSIWKKFKYIFFLLGCILFLFQFIGIGYFGLLIENHPFLWNVLYLPFVSIAISCFLPFLSKWKIETSFFNKPVVFISKISYSMYLLHYSVVLQLLMHFYSNYFQNFIQKIGLTAIYFTITIVLSYFLYRFYEKPIMDLRDKI